MFLVLNMRDCAQDWLPKHKACREKKRGKSAMHMRMCGREVCAITIVCHACCAITSFFVARLSGERGYIACDACMRNSRFCCRAARLRDRSILLIARGRLGKGRAFLWSPVDLALAFHARVGIFFSEPGSHGSQGVSVRPGRR